MAVHILNCSVDTPDAQPDSIAEDLSYNDIESISELVLEQILGFEDAIAEHDEHDTNDGYSFEIAKILLFFQTTHLSIYRQIIEYQDRTPNILQYLNINFSQFHPEIVSPPPQV
jgi:phosphate uptake regulator